MSFPGTFAPTLFGTQELINSLSTTFDGVDEYITLGADFNVSVNLSVSCWIDTGLFNNSRTIISKFQPSAASRSFSMEINGNGTLNAKISETGGTTQKSFTSTSGPNLEDAGWHHIGFTFADDDLRLYIDGVETTTSGNNPTINSIHFNGAIDMRIGQYNNGNQKLVASLDELTMWDTNVLDAAAMLKLYNFGKPNNPNTVTTTANLLHWYRLGDSDTATTILDNKGSRDGTLVNMNASNYAADVP